MQIKAHLCYWDDKPAMVLLASVPRSANKDKRYLIKMDEAWMYSEDFYEQVTPKMPPTFESFMMHKSLDLYELFDLGKPNSRQLAEVVWTIQDGIDQLVKMPPTKPRKKVVGEAKMTLNGQTVETEVTE
jgi:hypothetical protein